MNRTDAGVKVARNCVPVKLFFSIVSLMKLKASLNLRKPLLGAYLRVRLGSSPEREVTLYLVAIEQMVWICCEATFFRSLSLLPCLVEAVVFYV